MAGVYEETTAPKVAQVSRQLQSVKIVLSWAATCVPYFSKYLLKRERVPDPLAPGSEFLSE